MFCIAVPGSYDRDLGLRRTFPLNEKVHRAFEEDAIKIFNFLNSLTVTSFNFGKLTSRFSDSRVLQLAARIAL